MSDNNGTNRRKFLQFGLVAGAARAAGLSGCRRPPLSNLNAPREPNSDAPSRAAVDLEKWRRIKGKPYELGKFGSMPGVCKLPGLQAKRNWPDGDKCKDVQVVPGMCQLCSTVCGILGYVKDGRVIKIEGNPKDPNSRGHLCARGHAGLNHLYHPERLLYPLKRVGARGEGKWKRISWDEALDEIAEKLKAVRESGHPENSLFIMDASEVRTRSNDFSMPLVRRHS